MLLVASLWIQYLGVADTLPGDLREHLQKEQISFDVLLKRDKFELRSLRFPTAMIEPLAAALHEYREFSSVEGKRPHHPLEFTTWLTISVASYKWLSENGLGIYAVQFAKSNIPFYILPLVNYFVVYEMGIVIDDQRMYKRLKELRQCPAFDSQGKILASRAMLSFQLTPGSGLTVAS